VTYINQSSEIKLDHLDHAKGEPQLIASRSLDFCYIAQASLLPFGGGL